MNLFGNALLGVAFVATAVAATLLMYRLWRYPFDHEKLRSSAPLRWMFVHRALGWIFVAIYLYFMWQMVPRLWSCQIELPARPVMHLTLGMTIGVLLLVKVAIVRYFKHLERTLAPLLGTGLLICSVLLIGLSAPIAFRASFLEA